MCKRTPWKPKGSEAATDAQAPMHFKSRVFSDRNSGTSTPFRRLASSYIKTIKRFNAFFSAIVAAGVLWEPCRRSQQSTTSKQENAPRRDVHCTSLQQALCHNYDVQLCSAPRSQTLKGGLFQQQTAVAIVTSYSL